MSRHTTQRNLMAIADLLRRLQPDVTALQEADGPSAWSGNFDHVAALARMSGLPDHFRGDHNPLAIGRFRLASGTALLSRQPLLDPTSHRFALSWRDTKGFVIATVPVPAWGGLAIDLVSVHLDFLTPSARRRQIGQMVERLSGRDRPLVILGDLNCCWQYERESLEMLTESLGLEAWRPEVSQPTYPSVRPQRRLDWILVSHHLAFADHHTVAAPLSDHLGVVADVRLRDAAAVRPAAVAGERSAPYSAAPAAGAGDGLSACC
jgi:endonuclease/exonuclease/phosphatase family metal-dependent hydrolase